MRPRMIAAAAIASATAIGMLVIPAAGQTRPAFRPARTASGTPSFNGIWQALNTANYDIEDHVARGGLPEIGVYGATPPGQGVVEGGDIPYTPAGLKQKLENQQKGVAADPEAKCYLPGVPRATYMPYPFQIVQGTGKIMFVYGFAEANRTVHMDKARPEPAPIDTWMGRSHGRFEGDTLVIDVAGMNGQSWFDRAGNFASDKLHVVERYTMVGPDHMRYEATIEDPDVFTRPWKMSMLLYRRKEPNARVLEYKCVDVSEEMIYGDLRPKGKR